MVGIMAGNNVPLVCNSQREALSSSYAEAIGPLNAPCGAFGRIPLSLRRPDESVAIEDRLLLPVETGINSFVSSVADSNVAWVKQMDLVPEDRQELVGNLVRSQFEQLGGLCYRDCSRRQLEIATNMMTTLFVFDDMLDNARAVVSSSPQLLARVVNFVVAATVGKQGPPLDEGMFGRSTFVAVARALDDVTTRLRRSANGEDITNYLAYMEGYLRSLVVESEWQHKDSLGLSEYSEIRASCGAVYPSIELGFVMRGLSLSRRVRTSTSFRRMQRSACLCVAYVNDIFSYEKDYRDGILTNLPIILQRTHGLDAQEAIRRAVRVTNEVVNDYFEARREFCRKRELSPASLAYIKQMEDWMRGNFDWYNDMKTDRYLQCLSTARPCLER